MGEGQPRDRRGQAAALRERIRAFELGAENFVTLPVTRHEMAVRMEKALRRWRRKNPESVVRFCDFALDPGARVLRRERRAEVSLSASERSLLELLLARAEFLDDAASLEAHVRLGPGREFILAPIDREPTEPARQSASVRELFSVKRMRSGVRACALTLTPWTSSEAETYSNREADRFSRSANGKCFRTTVSRQAGRLSAYA